MYARGTERMLRCAALFAVVLLASPTRAQWDARPPGRLAPLTSGPAAISLVANLQSLSVSALPGSVPVAGRASREGSELMVTTAWTIRANCTTLRLSGNADEIAAFPSAPSAISGTSATVDADLDGSDTLSHKETGWTGIAQPVGPTNYPGSRTDSIGLGIDRSDHSSSAGPASPVFILVQAL